MNKAEQEALQQKLKGIVSNLPEKPGSYQYYDEEGTIIYVGKAKNLKRRVASYFNKDQNRKTSILVSKIRNITYTVVNTEEDALLLENALIKQYKPRYNVLLKDDKTYPSIAISQEYLPRIFKTRHRERRGATYFGPYSHLPTMYALLDLCQKLYKPRPCHQPMTEVGVKTGKYELCLNYHIHKCDGACIGKQSHEEYMRNIDACREILKGNTRAVAQHLRDEMARLSEEMRFEEAAILKRKYDLIENFRAKSEVVSQISYDIDVFSIESDEKLAYINFLHVVNGAITQSFTFEFKKKLDETDEALLALGIVEMRERFESKSKEIVLPFLVELPEDYAKLVVPQQGGKKTLLDLSRQNVKQYKFDRLKQAEKLNPEQKQVRLMKEIQTQLGLPSLPLRIEIFDNSNISGADAVAGCVVFDKLKPAKKEYRKFHIKTVEGLVKDHRHRTRELLFGNPPVSVGVQLDSYLFKVLTQMQDEVHRFAITFHRQQRSKRQTASALDNIPGIGEKTKQTLIQHFGSVKQILATTVEQFQEALGEKRGAKLFEALHPNPTAEKEV